MQLYEIIDRIHPETKIAVRFDKEVRVDTAMAKMELNKRLQQDEI